MSKTIFITGASRGFGKLWTEAFLKKGYQVVATARKLESLQELVKSYGSRILAISLDVNDRAACFEAVQKAKEHFGTIDVLINNAGYGVFGTIEEISEKEARDQMETNVFGLLWITQAVLPIMREQRRGHIIQVSSVLGLVTLPTLGIYNASKFAVEGLSETLLSEVKDFGIKVSIVEPNGFATDWGGTSAVQAKNEIDAYLPVKQAFQAGLTEEIFGIPEATVKPILNLVEEAEPPLRLFLGKVAFPWVKQIYGERLAAWEEWQGVASEAHGK